MEKDLIIGAASNYTWNELKYWVNSIRASKFEGDVVIVGTNMTRETIDKLTSEGVVLQLYGTVDDDGNIHAPQNNAPHVERFFYIWNYLEKNKDKYRNVFTTDTRDVIFQGNPSEWMTKNLFYSLVVSTEGIRYKNEPWGNQNLLDTFGPFFHQKLSDEIICNVGVMAGDANYIRSILLNIFMMSMNRPIKIVDQAVFNFIVRMTHTSEESWITTNRDSFAVNLGTTQKAIDSGSGDIGAIYGNDPSKMIEYQLLYEDDQPVIGDNGKVVNGYNEPYLIVHQYDRIPELKEKIEELYGDTNDTGPNTIFHHPV